LGFKLTCIVPTYNEPREVLKRAIGSVLQCGDLIAEIIVIDDGSSGNESEMAVDHANASSKTLVRLIKKMNGGPSSARNVGIQAAKCDWILFLDADDIFLPSGLLSKLDRLAKMKSGSVAGIYGGFIWSHTCQVQQFLSGEQAADPDSVGIIGKVPGGTPSFVIRKKALVDVGGFDVNLDYNEDIDLILRIMRKQYKFYGVAEPGFVRTISVTSHTRANKRKSLAGSRKFLRKAWRQRLLSRHEVARRYLISLAATFKVGVLELFI